MYYVLPEYPQLCSVMWEVSNHCQNDCYYCDISRKAGTSGHPTVEFALRFFNGLAAEREIVLLTISGGEPTMWEGLVEFLERKPDNVLVDLITNSGNDKIIYWERLPSEGIHNIVLSYHPEYTDHRRLLNVCEILRDRGIPHEVQLLVDFKYIREITKIFKKLKKEKTTVRGFKIRHKLINYSEDQLGIIAGMVHMEKEHAMPGRVVWNHELVSPRLLIKNKVNRFQGWFCRTSEMGYHIDSSRNVYAGSCRAMLLGSLDDIREIPLTHCPIVCPRGECRYLNDIRTEKWSPDLPTNSTSQIP